MPMRRRSLFALLLITLLLVATSAFAAQATVAERVAQVNQAIRAAHADWRAGENSFVATMPLEDFTSMLGVDRSRQPEVRDWWTPEAPLALPAHFDWRNVAGGYNFITPIRYQGRCGSCVAFAAVAAVEAAILIRDQTPGIDVDLSEQQAFDCSWGAGCDYGSTADDVLSTIANQGVVDEDCFPYMSGGTVYDYACSAACADASSRSFKIAGYQHVWGGIGAIKQAILNGGPVAASLDVYEDLKYYIDGVYQHVWGDYLGGHEVALIGWDDADGAWIAKNSWSANFGEDGFFRIKWRTCGISADTVKVNVGAAAFTPGSPPGGDCAGAGEALYQNCHLTYEYQDQSLSQDGFVAACNAGELPQCVHNCHEQHTDCNLLASCVGFCTDQWCGMDLTYLYDTCGLDVELTAGAPLAKDDAIALCSEVGYASAAMKCVLECVARNDTCGSLATCMAGCPMCPFPTVDFTADVTAAAQPPLTVTFTRNVVIPSGCDPTVAHWDFGDGSSSYANDNQVTHTYTTNGSFSVELRITNAAGPGIKLVPDMITVGPTPDDDAVDDDAIDDDATDDDATDDDAADDDYSADDDSASDDDVTADDDASGDNSSGDDSGGCGC